MKTILKLLLCFIPMILIGQVKPEVIPLWKNGAPGFENKKNEPERAKDWWVKNIHNPSITMYAPKKRNGTAVIICPGGGHEALVYNSEGKRAALYLNKLGITAFVLKYRLAREKGSAYKIDVHAKQDGIRAVRMVRFNAKKWGLNSEKIGMLGFSAGGEVVSMVSYNSNTASDLKGDEIDKTSALPNFQMLVYPGPLGIPEEIPKNAPPVFMVVANNDECCSPPVMEILKKYRKVGVPVEAHIYAKGDHAFNMGYKSDLKTLGKWPGRMVDWLEDNSYIDEIKD